LTWFAGWWRNHQLKRAEKPHSKIHVLKDTGRPCYEAGNSACRGEWRRWGRLDAVLEGLAAAKAAGLAIKINTVALKGVNEDEFDQLIEWCGAQAST